MKIIDLHCDTISCLYEGGEELGLAQNSFSVDLEKLRTGQCVAQFFALFVDLREKSDPLQTVLVMLDRFYREMAMNSSVIRVAGNYRELMENSQAGRISAFLTVEEGAVIRGQLAHLRNLYRLGVRLMTLTWNYPNEIGFPNHQGRYRDQGLTEFGREVVTEMNRLGMIVDVSHLSDQGFYDVADVSDKPFVASHSNARSVTGHMRNLTDEMIKLLAEKGGVAGINFANSFLGVSSMSRIEDMVAHIRHIRCVGGMEVVALGSDFDGISPELEIPHSGELGRLIEALAQAGFSDSELEQFCYQNVMRVIKDCL